MEMLEEFICEDYDTNTESDCDEIQYLSPPKKTFMPSETTINKKTKCLSRNALMARENRRRKKLYLESIEKEARYLREANRRLELENRKSTKNIISMKKEISYLRNVMSNSSNIEKLLKAINKALNPNVIVKAENRQFQESGLYSGPLLGDPLLSGNSVLSNSAISSEQEEINNQDGLPTLQEEIPQVGICLHVNNGHVSLGFCPLCNSSSPDSELLF